MNTTTDQDALGADEAPEQPDPAPAPRPDAEPSQTEADAPTAEQGNADEAPDETRGSNAEAAKWRVKFREADTERTALIAQLAAVRQDLVNDHAKRLGMPNPDVLAMAGHDSSKFFDSRGQLRLDTLKVAVQETMKGLGIASVDPRRGIVPTHGTGTYNPKSSSWADALRGSGV